MKIEIVFSPVQRKTIMKKCYEHIHKLYPEDAKTLSKFNVIPITIDRNFTK